VSIQINDPAERTARTLATVVGGLTLLILVGGWLLDVGFIRTLVPRWSPMAPLTALLLLLLSCAILLFERRRALANILLVICFVVAGAVIADYMLDLDLGVRQLTALFRGGRHNPMPELPAPDAAAAIMTLAIALVCMRTRSKNLHDFGDVTAAVIGIICLQVLVGYVYSVDQATLFPAYRQIAPHSTISMLLLTFAAFARRPTPGMFAALTGPQQSAWLLRRLIPVTVLLCALIGWLHLRALHAGVGATIPEIVAWSVTGAIVVLSLLLFVTSAEMRKGEAIVQRRQEELEAATMAAEAASEAKSRFMGVMSHELRTPLTQMIGYADLLDAGLAGDLSPVGKTYMNRLRASGWHLAGLIDAVLFYTGGKLPAEHDATGRLDVRALVAEVVGMFTAQAADKKLELEFDQPSDAVFVDVDERKLRQILINLLSNAVKFTQRGNIVVSLRGTGDTARIEVSDTGIGIDAEDLDRIWEPFQLLDASHTRTQGGMGLGLALTRRMTEQLGARISAESTIGRGAKFIMELPKSDPHARTNPLLSGARIVVVDDEPTVRRIMARTLTQHGAQVREAQSAAEALDTIEKDLPDVLVTDISMPGMTGIQLVETLRARRVDLPVLFVSGAELDAREQASLVALNARLLRKPFDMVELARSVQALRDSRSR
jgi:signal transduction histidine kinase/CheY-like chemotaxis protein